MKWLNNTIIAAIFAVVLTAIVAGSLKIPFFKDKESQTRDEMMLLSYNLHAKFAPLKPDSHLVFAPIDELSVSALGTWPIRRSVHGTFLQLLAPEKPKVVAWDILFTEVSGDDTSTDQGSPAQPTTAATVPAAPDASPTPSPPAIPTNSAPPAPETPAAIPTPSTNAPSPLPSPPATSAPSAAPSTNVPTVTPTTSVQGAPHFSGPMWGDAAPDSSPAVTNSPTPAAVPPDASTPSPQTTAPTIPAADQTPPPSSVPAPATVPANSASPPPNPAPPAANASPENNPPAPNPTAPPPATNPAETTAAANPPAETEDQLFIDGVSTFPNMVTAAAADNEPTRSLVSPNDILPTQPLTHVMGDTSQLPSFPKILLPFPALRKLVYFGCANEDVEGAGGVRRTLPLVIKVNGMLLPSFDLQVLMQYWDIDPDKVVVNLGHDVAMTHPDGSVTHVPIDGRGDVIINYRARQENFQWESYAQMGKGLSDKANDQKSPERDHLPPIKDNIVVLGVTIKGTDASPTPLDLIAPLVTTHLNLLNNILQHDFVYPINDWIWCSVYALLIFGIANLMLRVRLLPMIGIAVLSMILLAVGVFAALWYGNLLVPVAMPEIGLLLLTIGVPCKGFFGEEREKIRIRAAMSAYLSEKVMNQVLAHPDNVKLGGVKQVITIMFCDIRGFTKYCDNRDSGEVMAVLNDYMEEMTKVVFKYDGTVDKYIGDCIMAFWNAPQPQADHAQRAVCCAMEMRYALANFKTRRAGKDTELFECGIGIHTGEALVGNMGSSLKRNYTAMGSTVNLGARLEALTKRLNERILISQDTLDALTGEFPITDRGEATVPGFALPIHVYAVGADQDIRSALKVGRVIAGQQEYTAEEASEPIWKPAPLPEDADPNP